jgi:hypothetical protein
LAVVGIYGVIAYSVGQRLANSACGWLSATQRHQALWVLLRQNIRLITWKLSVGLVAAFELTRLMANLLYPIVPGDLLTLMLMATILMVALRYE